MALGHLDRFDYAELIGSELPAYQVEDLERVWASPRIAVCNPPGTGKTILVAALLARLAETDGIPADGPGRVLIVTQAGLLHQTASELQRFVPSLAVTIHTPQSLKRKRQPEPTPVEVVAFDTLKNHAETFKGFAVVVFDEASDLKAGSNRHESAMAVTDVAERIVVMTATPYETDPLNLYWILKLLRVPGVPPSYKEWCDKFVEFDESHKPLRVVGLKEDHLTELHETIDPYVIRRELDECDLPIPAIARPVVFVPLGPVQQAAYDAATLIPTPGFPAKAKRSHALRSACDLSGDESAKVAWLIQWLSEDPTRRTLVRTEYLELLELAAKHLDRACISYVRIEGATDRADRADLAERFRTDPSIRVCLGTRVLERGLNLQVVPTLISLGSSWNPSREYQAEGRIRRIGSPFDVVTHITIITDTSWERYKLSKLERRRADAAKALGDLPDGARDVPVVLQIPAACCTPPLVGRLREVLASHPGNTEVRLHLANGSRTTVLQLGDALRVSPSVALVAEIEALLGPSYLSARASPF